MATNTPFPEFKTTGDDKHDIEVFIEDLTDYCVMQNWFDPSKDTEAAKWTKPDKAMACLRAALSPAARAVYKYSLGFNEDDTGEEAFAADCETAPQHGRKFFAYLHLI